MLTSNPSHNRAQLRTRPTRPVAQAFILSMAFALSSCGPVPSEGPDLILVGGSIYPLGDSDRPVGAMAIQGDSVLATGTPTEILALATEDTQVMELDEECVLPGFFDAWVDPQALGRWSQAPLDVRLASTLEEVQAMVRNASAGIDPDKWLVGWGWNEWGQCDI